MVILGKWRDASLTLSVKPNCLTISLDSRTEVCVYSYDLAGRLWTAMVRGNSYRRGLDGKIVAKWLVNGITRDRKWLSEREAQILEKQASETASRLLDDIGSPFLSLNSPIPSEGLFGFQKASQFSALRSAEDILAYNRTYKPVGILPPDQYMSVVLQVTEGCSFNTCTFCNFYRDRPFRIKKPEEFLDHARMVKEFLGEGLSLRRTIFLGDANALVVPQPRLLDLLDIVHSVFDVEKLGGVFAFLDGFSGDHKTSSDYAQLASKGIKRIYIGMESGNAGLLRFLNKPGKPEDVLHAVKAIKDGNISVGIIVLLGAGGRQFARQHVDDTVDLINQMDLDLDDLIYFSELIESEGLEYTAAAYHSHLSPLTSEERIEQGRQIESRLNFPSNSGTPHISRYDIREFVY